MFEKTHILANGRIKIFNGELSVMHNLQIFLLVIEYM